MRLFPRSAFGQTVFLIGIMLLINQVVSYLSVAFYVIKPSTQQISHLIAKQVELALPAELEPPLAAALSAQLQQKTGVKLYDEAEALQHGLAEATYYGYFSQQLSDALQRQAEVRISQTDNFVFWVKPQSDSEFWVRVPLAGLDEASFPL